MRPPAAEGKVWVGVPCDLEPEGIGEDVFVVVRRDEVHNDLVPFADGRVPDPAAPGGRATELHGDRAPPQHLLHSGGDH